MFSIRHGNEKGFSLVEIIFAVAILAFGLLGLAAVIPYGSNTVQQASLRGRAMQAVNEGIEEVKVARYADVTEAKFPFQDYGEIPGQPELARSFTITTVTTASMEEISMLKMVTVRVFWRVSATQERSVYAVTYVGPNY